MRSKRNQTFPFMDVTCCRDLYGVESRAKEGLLAYKADVKYRIIDPNLH